MTTTNHTSPIGEEAPADLLPNALWTRNGSESLEWWSFNGYEARKDSADQWVLRKAGEELYRHTYLQVVMAHAERELLAASPTAPAQSCGEPDELSDYYEPRIAKCPLPQSYWTKEQVAAVREDADRLVAKLTPGALLDDAPAQPCGEPCSHDYVRSDKVCTECGEQADEAVTIKVDKDRFDQLMDALDRAESKGYMPDAIGQRWSAFEWEIVPPSRAKDSK